MTVCSYWCGRKRLEQMAFNIINDKYEIKYSFCLISNIINLFFFCKNTLQFNIWYFLLHFVRLFQVISLCKYTNIIVIIIIYIIIIVATIWYNITIIICHKSIIIIVYVFHCSSIWAILMKTHINDNSIAVIFPDNKWQWTVIMTIYWVIHFFCEPIVMSTG